MGKKGLNIYHRKDGRWEGRYKCGCSFDGKPKYRSIYAKSYHEVKEKLLKHQSQTYGSRSKAVCSLTVQNISAEWLKAKRLRLKASTYANYEFKLSKYILPVFGNLKIHELTPGLVHDFMQQKLTEGLSGKYVSDIIVLLKSITKYASKLYQCLNPIEDVELPKKEKHEMKLYSQQESAVLKSELLHNMNLSKLGILICLFTGIRIGELCALQWSDIDFQNHTLTITKTCQRSVSSVWSWRSIRVVTRAITQKKSSTSQTDVTPTSTSSPMAAWTMVSRSYRTRCPLHSTKASAGRTSCISVYISDTVLTRQAPVGFISMSTVTVWVILTTSRKKPSHGFCTSWNSIGRK